MADAGKKKSENEEKPPEKIAEKTRRVSERKIVYIDIDDEITTVYDQVKRVNVKEIYLVVPQRAVLLQSVINLKILKRKVEDLGKKLYIITSDKVGTKLAIQAEIQVFDYVDTIPKDMKKNRGGGNSEEMAPMKAASNEFLDDQPKRLKEKKISIHDVIGKYKRGGAALKESFGWFFSPRKRNVSMKSGSPSSQKTRPYSRQRSIATSLIVMSIGIFLLISYIVIPGATIALTPKSSVRTVSVNITLADYEKNNGELNNHPSHTIASYPVTTTVEQTIKYRATGQKFQGENAKGKIVITNKSTREWPLVPKTRFQTDAGLVFRIYQYVTVPPQRNGQPGTAEAEVIADEFDANGSVIGDRGNIGPSNFFLPALKTQESKESLSAASKEPMTGGTTISIPYIVAEDFQGAREKMEHELKVAAVEALSDALTRKNQEDNTDLILLSDTGAIVFGEAKISIPAGLEGQQQEDFEVSGNIIVSGVSYNSDEFNSILTRELRNSKSPDKKLVALDETSITYQIFEKDADTGRIKVTAQIKGVEEYQIDPEDENGRRLIENILERVAGMSVEDALRKIQNMPEIDKVEITTWPMGIPTLPKVPNHIKVEIVR